MLGPYLNGAAIFFGGALGLLLAPIIPLRLREGLPAAFAMTSIAMGVVMTIKVHQLPAVALALILGVAIGELCYMEKGVQKFGSFIQRALAHIVPTRHHGMTPEAYSQNFTALIVLFCASGTGVVGSLTEGMTGDYQLLLVKSLLDVFTAAIFATTLGVGVMTIALPQLAIQAALFCSARLIMPFMDDVTLGDFSACGGILMIAVGLRIAQIKTFAVVNFLPALVLIVPISLYWHKFMG
ncbi:membrane protein [Leminorella grimontii]|uniref:Membrane protein n=1 Tax=Leminorella grimontii TaxID=82981 RepID=A0AAV5N583_9GAMM|nr:DUF554 domain-containing protein [Leminorella grimontii]KFC95147.1 putative inner membrane protein [Leminorella grimontii ATCC 33999 = DSM 5078]GKX56254.1 membrane protein [Leminorella grimontii]GKX60435.1 membrane protein [Leminorella grimontii]VFS60876.1 Protein of uncharacterised function (DUF554) [Leminorella grimontii]